MQRRSFGVLCLLVLLSLVKFTHAQEEAFRPEDAASFLEQAGIDSVVQPLQEAIRPLFTWLKILVGGIFGLYLLMTLNRIYYERKKVNLLKDIRFDLDRLNIHFGISHSAQRKGFFGHLWAKIKR